MSVFGFKGAFDRFIGDTRGAVAIIFGLTAVLLFLITGAAVDFSQALAVRQKLGNAIDAAALAVGSSGNLSQQDAEQLARDVFNANFPSNEIGTPGQLSVTLDGQMVNLNATASVNTAFLGVIGMHTIDVGIDNQVTREGKNLEIVMVLDNTGSMSGQKIDDLKTSANLLVDIVFGNNSTSSNAKIGLVPFATSVNIGAQNAINQGWIDTKGQSSVNAFNFQPNTNIYQLYQDMQTSGVHWRGCVLAREQGFDMRDKPPIQTDPETLWVPYLYPDEPGSGGNPWSGYSNSYYNDNIGGSADNRQRFEGKYSTGQSLQNSKGPNHYCPTREILPMTNVKATLIDNINQMEAKYTTNIPIGIAWGWRLISKKEPFTEGSAYNNDDYIKAMIVLTDGDNYIGYTTNHNKSDFTSYGYIADGRLASTVNQSISQLNSKTSQVCNRVKNKGIIVYTITFQVSSSSTKTMMKNCATDDTKYFDSPSGDDLKNIFGTIAKELSNLRLSK